MPKNKLPPGFFYPERRRGDGRWESDVIHFRLVIESRRQSFKGYSDLRATQALAAELRRQIERAAEGEAVKTDGASPLLLRHLRRLGLVSAVPRKQPKAMLAEWKASLLADGDAKEHVERQASRVQTIMDSCDFKTPSQINSAKVKQYLFERREAGGRDKPFRERFGIQTSNHWLTAIKTYCNYLVTVGVLAKNPLADLAKLNVEEDVRRERTELPSSSTEKLLKHLANRKQTHARHFELNVTDRRMIYELALATGLRASELASLTPNSFKLDATPPTVTVEAKFSKRRRLDVLPLRSETAKLLSTYLNGKASTKRLWPGNWYQRAAEMIVADLKAAGLPVTHERGVVDFHSLRHTFITRVGRCGVSPKVHQTLARHSTYALTAKYSHATEAELVRAVESL